MSKEPQTTNLDAAIKDVVTTLVDGFDKELFALKESELEKRYYFHWNESASVAWNVYQFSDLLEMYKHDCRRWEEKHHGRCCVVERVREKYLMPKIKDFINDMDRHEASK